MIITINFMLTITHLSHALRNIPCSFCSKWPSFLSLFLSLSLFVCALCTFPSVFNENSLGVLNFHRPKTNQQRYSRCFVHTLACLCSFTLSHGHMKSHTRLIQRNTHKKNASHPLLTDKRIP